MIEYPDEYQTRPISIVNYDMPSMLDTGWRCVVCFELAQCMDNSTSLCVDHAKQWNHGCGKSLLDMQKDLNAKT